jgi:hypothetical protein
MIPQGYPLFVVDEAGGLHTVVGWIRARRDGPVTYRPVLVDVGGLPDDVGAAVEGGALRYFVSVDEARRYMTANLRSVAKS